MENSTDISDSFDPATNWKALRLGSNGRNVEVFEVALFKEITLAAPVCNAGATH